MKKLLIATSNKGKVQEIENFLAGFDVELVSLNDYDIESPEETGKSFIENAALKAKYYGDITGIPSLADDSGLCIDTLNGDPGIYSADWAGEPRNFDVAMNLIQEKLKDKGLTESKAQYVCAISLYDRSSFSNFEAIIEGKISFPKKGDENFGYDPIFTPEGSDKTFGEMSFEEKLPLSARYLALKKFIQNCST